MKNVYIIYRYEEPPECVCASKEVAVRKIQELNQLLIDDINSLDWSDERKRNWIARYGYMYEEMQLID